MSPKFQVKSWIKNVNFSNVLILSCWKPRYREHFLKKFSDFCLKKTPTSPPHPLRKPCGTRLSEATFEKFNIYSSTSCNWFLVMVKYSREMENISSNRVRQCLWLRGRSNSRQLDTHGIGCSKWKAVDAERH